MNNKIFTVSALNQHVKNLLETDIGRITVEGEISNFIHHSSGHMYFSLKDKTAEIRATLFKSSNQRLKFRPENGMAVEATGVVSLYPQRGTYQINITSLKEAGAGNLQAKFEALKNKLNQEGLFNSENKLPIPNFSKRVGVITSPTGAVIEDIRQVLSRRAPWLEILVYPTKVQGDTAKDSIASMIELANQRNDCDVLIVARGGGSLEDLWPFNEEVVARAIANSALPIISAVGHQTDYTIADFVADIRAATPSEAAEQVAPDGQQLLAMLRQNQQRLRTLIASRMAQLQQTINNSARLLRSPQSKIQNTMQVLDDKSRRLERAQTQAIASRHSQLIHLKQRLDATSPQKQLKTYEKSLSDASIRLKRAQNNALIKHKQQLNPIKLRFENNNPKRTITTSQQGLVAQQQQLILSIQRQLEKQNNRLQKLQSNLNHVNPTAILARGYSITLNEAGKAIKTASQLSQGQSVTTLFNKGEIESTVTKLKP